MPRQPLKSLIFLMIMSLVTATGSIAEILTHIGHQHELGVVATVESVIDTGSYSLPVVKPGVQGNSDNAHHHHHQLTADYPESESPGSETAVQQNECVCDDICCAVSAMSPTESPRLTEAGNSVHVLNKAAVYDSIFIDLLIPPPETQSI